MPARSANALSATAMTGLLIGSPCEALRADAWQPTLDFSL
jgi:hypothetical protein